MAIEAGSPGSTTSLRAWAALLLVAGMSACAADPVRIEERDGVVHVDNGPAGLWQDRDPPPLRFELERTFGAEAAPEEAVLGDVAGLVVDPQGNLYLLDQGMRRLASFGPDGGHRWTAGREGQGPGEFSDARSLAWDGESTLFVTNRQGSQVDRWDLGGSYLDSRLLAPLGLRFGGLVGHLPPASLVLVAPVFGTLGGKVVVVTTAGEWRKEAEFEVDLYPDLQVPRFFAGSVDVKVDGEWILVGHEGVYELRWYDRSGELFRVVRRPVGYLRRAGFHATERGGSMRSFGGLEAPLALASGHWLATASWPTNVEDPDAFVRRSMGGDPQQVEWACSLDLFDPEGRFLLSLVEEGRRVPGIGEPLGVGPDGRLYTFSEEPYPQVRRYRVELEEA